MSIPLPLSGLAPSLYPLQIPIKVIQGGLYVRVSVHVYNDINDIKELAAAVNEIITNGGVQQQQQQQ